MGDGDLTKPCLTSLSLIDGDCFWLDSIDFVSIIFNSPQYPLCSLFLAPSNAERDSHGKESRRGIKESNDGMGILVSTNSLLP